MIAAICNHDDERPCPVCGTARRIRLRVVTPEGICPPRVVPCPHCTDAEPTRAAAQHVGARYVHR